MMVRKMESTRTAMLNTRSKIPMSRFIFSTIKKNAEKVSKPQSASGVEDNAVSQNGGESMMSTLKIKARGVLLNFIIQKNNNKAMPVYASTEGSTVAAVSEMPAL